MAIEKFRGKFSIEDGGCTIIITETSNIIRNGDAAALYYYLICRSPDWELNIDHLKNHFSWGKTKVYNALTYLQEIFLLKKIEHREKGRFIKHEYILMLRPFPHFSPLPKNEEVDETSSAAGSPPLPSLPEAVAPQVDIAETYKTKIYTKQRKEKNKEKIIKENNKRKILPLSEMLETNPHNIPAQLIEEWITARHTKRSPITLTVWQRLNKQLSECHCGAIEAFEEMISRGWITVKPEWINKSQNNSKGFFDDNSSWTENKDDL